MKYHYLHLTVFLSLLFVVVLVLGVKFIKVKAQDKNEVEAFIAHQEQAAALYGKVDIPKVFSYDEQQVQADPMPKYRELYAQNNDFAGWVQIENTPLNLPVMYTPQNGEYYLYRFFDKTHNDYGTPFIDARCSLAPRSTNLILHGHNMNDSEMFGSLLAYTDKEYYTAHPIIKFDTVSEAGEYQIVSAFLSQYNEKDSSQKLYYNYIDLSKSSTMEEFSQLVKSLSMYDTGFTLQPGDELITMITCSYHVKDGRMAVVAKKINSES